MQNNHWDGDGVGADQARPRLPPLVIDLFIALGWMLRLGFPLYFLFMLLLDYEHFLHGAQENFSIEAVALEIIPYHRSPPICSRRTFV